MRLIIRVISAVLVAVALLLGVVLLLPGEKVANLAADQLERQTGRKLTFAGPVRFTFWPILGMKADGVTLSNAEWAGAEPMLRAERLTIGLAAADLLRGDVRVTELSAILPHLNLSTRADGLGNWVLQTASADEASGPETETDRGFSVERIALTGASMRYAPFGGDTVEMTQIDLMADWPDPNGTAHIDLTLRPAGAPIRMRGEVGTFAQFLDGMVASVGMTIETPGGMARFDGNADLTGAAQGRMTAEASDLNAVLAAVGQDITLPAGLGPNALLAADMTYTSEGQLSLRDMTAGLGTNQLRGALDLNTAGERPKLTAQLTADALTLPSDTGTAAQSGDTASTWPKEDLDASALGLLDAQVGLRFDSLSAGDLTLGASALTVTIDRSRAVLDMQPMRAFGGTITGELVANNRSGLSVGGSVSFDGVRLEQALGQMAGFDNMNGALLGEVKFLGVGNSVDAIIHSLSGQGWFEVGKGFYTGFDLEALMRSGGGNGGSTVFDSLSASFAIADGIVQNSDLLAQIKGAEVTGAGQIMLGAQALDYTFKPTLGDGDTVLTIPVKVTGPWADPKIRPDLEGALRPRLEAVETEIKEEAKEQLREKIAEELDTEVAPEQDLNDVLKNRIEQEAKEQLLRLLGGN
ncbi:AsmA family protein [Epibacterium sp. SM1979]|uniref:AsmA family protein n=1 Tax=Tritonibacter litoralis TaxID=2662264 RepID=A0A843YE68_9RHOB|nr:AsmA family protein [Tritonibacter litoralis]MQQ07945.1 AsmA family protein [Tritonibacter litoralis]